MAGEDPIVKRLTTAKVKLLIEQPFLGNMATCLLLVEAPWCKTAATDGRHLFYNREFIKALSIEQLLFLVAHEIYHCLLDHIGRRGKREPRMANAAMDYVINYSLSNGKNKVGSMPPNGCLDPKYTDNMLWEEVYEDIKANSLTFKIGFDEHLDAEGSGEDEGEGQEGGAPQTGKAGKGGKGGKQVEVTVTGKDGPPKLTAADLDKIRQEIRSNAIRAAAADPGSVPGNIRRLLDELIHPRMDWKSLLDSFMRSALKDDYTFERLSRRSWFAEALMPALNYTDRVEIEIWIDASASITKEDIIAFLSEVRGIVETFRDYKIVLGTFDTRTYDYIVITPENVDDFDSYEPEGGGGTMFECIWDLLRREDRTPHRLIVFTDGMPAMSWGDPDYCETLFIIKGNRHITAPFGQTAHYEDAD